MKLTFEPHNDSELVRRTAPYSTVSVSIPPDDLTLTEFFEELIIPALLAYGFAQSSIDEWLDKPDTDSGLLEELDSLRRWKAEAMKVMPDYQKLGGLLDLPVGSDVSSNLYGAIESLINERDDARKRAEQWRNELASDRGSNPSNWPLPWE